MTEYSREALYQEVTAIISKLFEIEPGDIKPESRLFEDLELDSIDAVDLIVQMQKRTGRRFKPEDFKMVRTVDDVVNQMETLLNAKAEDK